MNRMMVNGPQPACCCLMVWRPGGIDKEQRRRLEGAVRRRADDSRQGPIARALGELDAARRRLAIDVRLILATVAPGADAFGAVPFGYVPRGVVPLGSAHAIDAPTPPNRPVTHDDAYRGIRSS